MKAKNLVWMIGGWMVLASSMLWMGCEKDLVTPDAPKPDALQMALDIPGEIAALLTTDEIHAFQDSYAEARRTYAGAHTVLPVMIRMKVRISQPAQTTESNLATRENDPGGNGVDLAIMGEGYWTKVGRMRYFEVQYEPNQWGFWKGEGWLRRNLFGTNDDPAIFFTSEKWMENIPERTLDFCMTAQLNFSGGTCEFQWSFGEGVRKLFLSEDDPSVGEVLIYGYLALYCPVECVEEVCP
ncbi:MAG: hypothetical protein IPL49_19825 [Saprospirales bacterium]|nr:hypothetical protein [Saprospirales bacterium]MBK8493063.1 hypothetical protein [Saprospirales bacterium]